MKDVNSLIRLPQFAATMQELSVELMKAGIMEEMVGDMLPVDGDMLGEGEEEEEAEGEVDKVLGEILKDRMETAGALPSVPLPVQQVPQQQVPAAAQKQPQVEEEDEEDTEAMMDQMRNRLEALRS
jgi:charged multivesicular body protein 3